MSLNQEVNQLTEQIDELTTLKSSAKLPSVQAFLQKEINRLSVAKSNLEKEIIKVKENAEKKTPTATGTDAGSILVTNYMWDQTNDYVKIYIEVDKSETIPPSEIKLEFASKTKFSCIFGKYRFTLGRLYKAVDQEKCKAVITKSNRLVITLYKENKENWLSLNQEQNRLADDMKNEMNDDPGKGLMKMMQRLYDEGDDEMKRTIAKSWYEARNKQGGSELDMPEMPM